MRISTPTAIVLDTSPLGLITQKDQHVAGAACRAWSVRLVTAGCRLFVPEIADYETRRELLRSGNVDAVQRLEIFNRNPINVYLPLTTSAVLLASELWAQARQAGRPTASPDALDGDVLISAQARLVVPEDFGLNGIVIAQPMSDIWRLFPASVLCLAYLPYYGRIFRPEHAEPIPALCSS